MVEQPIRNLAASLQPVSLQSKQSGCIRALSGIAGSRQCNRMCNEFPAIFLSLLFSLLFLSAGVVAAQVVGTSKQSHTFTVPFHTVNGMILLDATLNGKSVLLLTLALAVAIWLLCGIARVVRSEEFRRDVERLREQRWRKRGNFLAP